MSGKNMKKKAAIMGSTHLVLALGGVTALNVTNPDWKANTIFATAKDKQLAWLGEHEEEIVSWVHSEYPKVETVQFDWNTLKVVPVSVGFTIEGYNLSVRGTFNDIPETKITIDFRLDKENDIPTMNNIMTNNKPGIIRSGVLYNYE